MRNHDLRTRLLRCVLGLAVFAGGLAAPVFSQDSFQDMEQDPGMADQITVTQDAAEGGWFARRTPLEVMMETPAEGRLAFVIDQTDLTDLFRPTETGWLYRANELPLPVGEHTLTVFHVVDGHWQTLAELPLQVMTDGGITERRAGIDIDLDAHGTVRDEDGVDEREETGEASMQLAFDGGFAHRSGSTLDANVNVVGVSDEDQALRAGLDDSPDRVDLASYLVRYANDRSHVEMGHTRYGASRYLIDGFGARGLSASLRFGEAVEVSAAVLNGTDIVGWQNPVGLDDSDHRILAGGVGFELVPSRPGTLRVDLTFLDGSVLPLADFNQGAVTDAEESDGWSVELSGSVADSRLRFAGGYARSNFTNPEDPTLDPAFDDVVAVEEEERDARHLRVDLDLVRDAGSGANTWNASLGMSHARVDPLYRSVAAFAQADLEENRAQLDVFFGGLSAQAFHSRTEDNLDHIPSILTTLTRITGVQLVVPFADFASEPSVAIPTFSLGGQRTRQFADELPVDGGFSASHLPDQVSESIQASLEWSGGLWQAGLRAEDTSQDNRQLGRETADFDTRVFTIFGTFAARTDLDLGIDASHERFESLGTDEEDVTDRIGVNVMWRITDTMTWTSNVSWTSTEQRPLRGETESVIFDTEWVWRFLDRTHGARGDHGIDGRVYLRFSSDDTDTIDRLFGFDEEQSNWTLVSGISLGIR